MVCSFIFWGASTPAKSISYLDSLLMITSTMTESDLNTLNLSELNTFQQRGALYLDCGWLSDLGVHRDSACQETGL
jgi:hypothetical protein